MSFPNNSRPIHTAAREAHHKLQSFCIYSMCNLQATRDLKHKTKILIKEMDFGDENVKNKEKKQAKNETIMIFDEVPIFPI